MKSLDDQWNDLIDDFMANMSAVECGLDDYLEGLRYAHSEITDRISGVKEEIRNRDS